MWRQIVCCVMLLMTVVSSSSINKKTHVDPYQFVRSDIGLQAQQQPEYLILQHQYPAHPYPLQYPSHPYPYQYPAHPYQYQYLPYQPVPAVPPQPLAPPHLPSQPYPSPPVGPVHTPPYLLPTYYPPVLQYEPRGGSAYPEWSVSIRPDLLDHDHMCHVVLEHNKQMMSYLFGEAALNHGDFSFLQCKTRSELLDLKTVMTDLQSMDKIFTALRIPGFDTITGLSPLSCFGQQISDEIQAILVSKAELKEERSVPAWCNKSGDEEDHSHQDHISPDDDENEYIDVVKKPETRGALLHEGAGYTTNGHTLDAVGPANEPAMQKQKRGSFSWSWNWNTGDSWSSGNSWNSGDSWNSWDSDFSKPSRRPTYSRKKSGCKYSYCYYSHTSYWDF